MRSFLPVRWFPRPVPGRGAVRWGVLLALVAAPAQATEGKTVALPGSGGPFLRLSLGPAVHRSASVTRVVGGSFGAHVSGVALDAHALAGWWFPQQFGLGLGLSTLFLPAGQGVKQEVRNPIGSRDPGRTVTLAETPGTRATMLGFALQTYLDPAEPWFLQGIAGFATLPSFRAADRVRDYAGPGLVGGLGHDFWTFSHARVGLLGQIHLMHLRDGQTAGNGNGDASLTLFALSLVATVSFR